MYETSAGVFVQAMRDVRIEDSWVEGLEERCFEKRFPCFFSNYQLALEKIDGGGE